MPLSQAEILAAHYNTIVNRIRILSGLIDELRGEQAGTDNQFIAALSDEMAWNIDNSTGYLYIGKKSECDICHGTGNMVYNTPLQPSMITSTKPDNWLWACKGCRKAYEKLTEGRE